MKSWRHSTVMAMLLAVAMASMVAGCSDDDTGGATSTESTGSATATSASESPDTDPAVSDTTAPGSTDPAPVEEESALALVDMVEITVLGHPMGAPADPVIADLIARLGDPDHDSDWGPTECPPSSSSRFLGWSEGLRVYFSDAGGRVLDGAAFELIPGEPWADLVVFPDGVGWGDPITDVAIHQNGEAEYSDWFGWWEVWVAEADNSRAYLSTTDGPLDRVVVGYEPRCH